jgi:hypothetical protein
VSTVAALRGGARARPALRPAAVLAVASASSFLVYLDATIVNIAFPDVRASFAGATLSGLSWILSAYGIVFAALLVPGGRLADVLGGRRVFLAGRPRVRAPTTPAGGRWPDSRCWRSCRCSRCRGAPGRRSRFRLCRT